MLHDYAKHKFVAIIGDIKHSRDLENRKEVQKRLQLILEKINFRYKDHITSKFIITLGDEFQGLLCDGKCAMTIIEEIRMSMYPIEIRFGIGIGKMATDINTEMALGADGPGYHCARTAIDHLKENEKKNKSAQADIRVEWESDKGSGEPHDCLQAELLNTVFELLKVTELDWTDRQREIVWTMQRYQDGQKKAAERLGIAQSTLNKALTTSNYYAYAKAIKDVTNVLGEML